MIHSSRSGRIGTFVVGFYLIWNHAKLADGNYHLISGGVVTFACRIISKVRDGLGMG